MQIMIICSYILVINEMLDDSDGDKILLQCNNYQDDHQDDHHFIHHHSTWSLNVLHDSSEVLRIPQLSNN